jgi:hypothetical protein
MVFVKTFYDRAGKNRRSFKPSDRSKPIEYQLVDPINMLVPAEDASGRKYLYGGRSYYSPPTMAGMSEIYAVFCLAQHFFLEQV